jgi:hypothetical protein
VNSANIALQEFCKLRHHVLGRRLYASPPNNSVVICVDEMGPLSVRPYPGRKLVRGCEGGLAGRAKWELALDRDRKPGGYVFGAFIPATGEALTETYDTKYVCIMAHYAKDYKARTAPSL